MLHAIAGRRRIPGVLPSAGTRRRRHESGGPPHSAYRGAERDYLSIWWL